MFKQSFSKAQWETKFTGWTLPNWIQSNIMLKVLFAQLCPLWFWEQSKTFPASSCTRIRKIFQPHIKTRKVIANDRRKCVNNFLSFSLIYWNQYLWTQYCLYTCSQFLEHYRDIFSNWYIFHVLVQQGNLQDLKKCTLIMCLECYVKMMQDLEHKKRNRDISLQQNCQKRNMEILKIQRIPQSVPKLA